ncbi:MULTISPECIES: Uma2 family endonuclease [unclassified Streptomyces]|uniref:Uma2 family endonuclease n=1 Tax=unclassified Streptomyces TaxID=2593676 RepID=UPI00225C1634|nr:MULTISPECIES: Uma2 family endonuclease [unclassified Streptomyces]WSP56993.1 Uma2 family endonuclease [Streptomyces sp. NBC_01241]WSU22290.1 Uma2 family endonuclease [Streptomyces sp. NBC_01108]MCX4788783.1 Uma2 family endonuclease [Streptomyces sp. NBC_01221]MCX4795469.1 Uma2 family endonuclease [Streptomyces sp. NBC_01242]WSJ36763.1 Uma2 family endonuclease [Streptomyces sp. NBC_01321]
MSAASESKLAQQRYRWPIPPEGGWTADDLDRIPGLPPHTELIDGSLVFMSPQTVFHGRAMRLFENALLDQAPDHLDVLREMTIKLDQRNRPEPDVLVFPVEANTGYRQTWFRPEDVILAVEVVSDDSVERDREVKPRKYAAAGVRHFWRVEASDEGLPVVYAYELDPALKTYVATGIHHDKLRLTVPFPIEIDLTAINRRRP